MKCATLMMVLASTGLSLPSQAGMSFTGLGFLSEEFGAHSYAYDISGDGSTVVGRSSHDGSGGAFVWTQTEGMVSLGEGLDSAYCVSQDGSVIAGNGIYGNLNQTFRWTRASGASNLGNSIASSASSHARDISGDGSKVVGYFGSNFHEFRSYRWTQDSGSVNLGSLYGGQDWSVAAGISADGSVVVGHGSSANGQEAFRWTQTGGMERLGDLDEGTFSSIARGISADGLTIVGEGRNAYGTRAVQWTESGDILLLDPTAYAVPYSSSATAVSADGSKVIGYTYSNDGYNAFVWDEANGMRVLKDVLQENGVDVTGWSLNDVESISDDGKIIVGHGTNPQGNTEAFVAVIPEPGVLAMLGACSVGLWGCRRLFPCI